jgi:hypothetical protein
MRHLAGTAIMLRTRTGRLTAALVAFACFAGQLASLEHLASGPHITCPEHGELEDVPSVAHVGERLHEEAAFENEAAPTGGHGHEHCIFASHARQVGRDVQVGKLVAVQLARTAPPVAARAALLAPRAALYRLAPKTSPPA